MLNKWININKKVISITSILYVIWALWFIYRSSFLDHNGSRHFLVFDDGMISFRYALNLVNGIGLTWNPDEFVEGFTNPLWTMVMALSILLAGKVWAPFLIQILAIILIISSTILIYKITIILTKKYDLQESVYTNIPSIIFLAYYPISYWSLGGMEVSLLVFLTILATYVVSKHLFIEKTNNIYITLFLLISAAYLTRPDGFIVLTPLLGMVLYDDYENKTLSIKKLSAGIIFMITILIVIGFRYHLYKELNPNTYYLKMGGYDLGWRLSNGAGFVSIYILEMIIFIAISLYLSFYLFFKKNDTSFFLFLLVPLTSIAYQIYVGGDPWDRWRQLSPSIFILFISTALIPHFVSSKRFIISIILVAFAFADIRFVREQIYGKDLYSFAYQKKLAQVAFDLNSIATKNATVAVFWAGTIPYYFEGVAIDMLGKSDKKISHMSPSRVPAFSRMEGVPGHSKYDLNYSIRELQPDWIQGFYWENQNLNDFASINYVKISYNNRSMEGCFKKDSNNIVWKKVEILSAC